MNIFYLHKDPVKAAQYQYNKHVVKMILESAQMLCTAHHHYAELNDYNTDYIPYKKAHYNHPSTVWVRQNSRNYYWLYHHMLALGDEYKKRYGKKHLSITKCCEPLQYVPTGMPLGGPIIQPPQAMPDEYKHKDSIVAYWQYYIHGKSHIAHKDEELYLTMPADV